MRFEGGVIRKTLGIGALAAILLTGAAGPASAVVFTEFNSFAGWVAAVGPSSQLENFSDATLLPGVSFALTGSGHTGAGISSGVFNDRLVPGSTTTWTFAVPIYGFGGRWDLRPGGPGLGIDVFANGLSVFAGPSIDENFAGQFWGFTSDTPFTMVRLQTDGQGGSAETYNLDNMVFAPVPEPGTMLLVGSGLVGLALKRRRHA